MATDLKKETGKERRVNQGEIWHKLQKKSMKTCRHFYKVSFSFQKCLPQPLAST